MTSYIDCCVNVELYLSIISIYNNKYLSSYTYITNEREKPDFHIHGFVLHRYFVAMILRIPWKKKHTLLLLLSKYIFDILINLAYLLSSLCVLHGMYVCRYAYCSPGEYPAWWDGGWRIITSVFPCWCWHLWTSSEFLLPRHLCFLVMDSGAAGEGTTDHPLVHCLALNNPHSWMTPNGYHLSLDTHFTIEHLFK